MMQPIPGAPARPPGADPDPHASAPGQQPLSGQQRTVLERLITRIIALTHQQTGEVWAGLRHDLNLGNDTPLLSRHFPAAEQNLNLRLDSAQQGHANRQVLQQLTELLSQGNNRQAVSDYIRTQWGHTALSQLTPAQVKTVLTLLQQNQLAIPQPQQRVASERPLLPAEHVALNQQVGKLAASTGESPKIIWESMLELCGVDRPALVPVRQYPLLTTWLHARLTLSNQPAPTLQTVQAALKQPLEGKALEEATHYAQQQYNASPATVLTTAQVQDVLNFIFLKRAERSPVALEVGSVQPIYSPLFASVIQPLKAANARPGMVLMALLIAALVFWLVL